MNKELIMKLAQKRAEELFTPEFYQHVTDSWYLDEKFRFEDLQVGSTGRKPTKHEAGIYMKYLDDLFREYEDRFYSDTLAQSCYGSCINHFKKIFEFIDYGNKTYSKFNIDEETIQKLKDLANIFVYKHNSFANKYYM